MTGARTDRGRWQGRWGSALVVAAVTAAGAALNAGFDEPPRFDGASYAMLARSLLTGQGYRNIDHPDAPPHAHYPPGYPSLIAATWALTGRSASALHATSILCTAGAAVAAYLWFRRQYPGRVALLLGMALAMNWAWHRMGGSIRSEPVYMMLSQLALLAAVSAARAGGTGRGIRLGVLLGALTLTRHIGAAVDAAVGVELAIRRRWRALAASVLVSGLIVAPWAYRLVSTPRPTQLGLLPGGTLPGVVAGNLWFYVLRTPDALTGPYVEVGTIFAPRAFAVASAFAVVCGAVLVAGLVAVLRAPRRRMAGLVVACNLALLLVWPFTEAGRFLVPLVPALLVVATEGIAAVLGRVGVRRRRAWAAGLLLAAATPYSSYSALAGRASAERQSQAEVDAALGWIARHGDRPGPIMTTYPAESFWFTDRPGIVPPEEPDALDEAIDRHRVAYLVAVEGRFARAADDPIARFSADRPGRLRRVWSSESGAVAIFEPIPPDQWPSPKATPAGAVRLRR